MFSEKHIYKKDLSRRDRKKRMAILGGFFAVSFVIISYRLVTLHLIKDPKLERMASSQYRETTKELKSRGNIYDADGEELAVSIPSYSLALRPNKLRAKAESMQQIATILGMPLKELEDKFSEGRKYAWVKRDLLPAEKDRLLELQSKEVALAFDIVKESKRYYPNREVGGQVLGAVGRDHEGLAGLEKHYDDYLRAGGERTVAFRDARGKGYETAETLEREITEPSHIYLTIRKNIQYVTETELANACRSYRAKGCTATVMDPQTGAILAMASYPNFNPNEYQKYNMNLWKNSAVVDTYEPGSTFKAIMASAALEGGRISPKDKFFCENGALKIGKYTINDHEGYGMMNLRDILKVSSNIGIYKVAQKTTRKVFGEVISQFGYGQKLGIDYPGESPGYVRASAKWQDIEFANVAFGQGVRVTPLQVASSFATIANHGVRMKPYLVSRIVDGQGKVLIEKPPHTVGRVMSEENAKRLIDMLTEVTTEGGTATRAAVLGYQVAGKTGTSQKFVNGQYSHTKFISSFVGIVPQESPRLVVMITVDEPQGVIYGGLVAAPIFQKIAWASLRDLGVPPENELGRDPHRVEVAAKTTVKEKKTAIKEAKTSSDKIENFIKNATTSLNTATENAGMGGGILNTVLASGVGETRVPDFRGLSKRKVMAMTQDLGMRTEFVGSGIAVSQTPAPGSMTSPGLVCRILFKVD